MPLRRELTYEETLEDRDPVGQIAYHLDAYVAAGGDPSDFSLTVRADRVHNDELTSDGRVFLRARTVLRIDGPERTGG